MSITGGNALQLLVNGVDLTGKMDTVMNPWSITKQFSRQGDTASFFLVDEHSTATGYTYYLGIDQEIVLKDTVLNKVMFSGICNKPQFGYISPNMNTWTLNCVDYSTFADNKPVFGDVINTTAGQALVNFVNQANCGLSASLVANGGFVTPGPTIQFLRVNYQSLSQTIKDICKVASQQGGMPYGWRVDENFAVHFQSQLQNIASGVTLTDDIGQLSAAKASPTTIGYFDPTQFSYNWDATQLHNQVTVIGSQQKGIRTDTWTADGSQTQYLLSFPLDTTVNSASLKIGGVTTAVTVIQTAGASSPTAWYVNPAQNGQWSLLNPSALPRGTTVAVTYHYTAPVVAQVSNYDSQSYFNTLPNKGVFGVVENNSSIATLGAAQAEANAQLNEFAWAQEQHVFVTNPAFTGYIEIGETYTLDDVVIPDIQNANAIGINDTFILTQATWTGMANQYRTLSGTGIRL